MENNWREVYNSKVQFLALINGWENWEPKDKSKKDTIRTYWTRDKEDDKKMSSERKIHQEKPWWEVEDEGNKTDMDLKAEYDWEDKTIGKIMERLTYEEETDDYYDEERSGKNGDDVLEEEYPSDTSHCSNLT